MEKNLALTTLVKLTNEKLGYTPSTPSEFNELTMLIERHTGRSISLSSIKRIWGYVRYEGFPSVTTLNNLAKYNGFQDWNTFLNSDSPLEEGCESCFLEEGVVDTDKLSVGDRLSLCWNDDKACVIECVGRKRFRVISSENIKLLPEDEVSLHTIGIGHPLYVTDIQRGEERFYSYTGAQKGGVTDICLTPCTSSSN